MCLARVYVENQPGPVMEEVSYMEIHGGMISIVNLFGEKKEIEGKLQSIDFEGSKVVIIGDGQPT